jgi:hypothetical protein
VFGKALAARRDRTFRLAEGLNIRVVHAGEKRHAVVWRLEQLVEVGATTSERGIEL